MGTLNDTDLCHAIEQLIENKRQGFESQEAPRIDIISDFIDAELKRLDNGNFPLMQQKPDFEPLNRLFRDTLAETESN